MRKILSVAMMLLMLVAVKAQQPTELPLDPNVRTGVLPNKLTYYIMKNTEPKQRANFYIAQKVGSTLETPEQLGLAHFLEHMAFNGTKHYPGHQMLDYLQNKGIRFGSDINAYTSFDETVYNINNVPTTDKALMDSVLLVLHDWSGSILLAEDEINAERGVIHEEWRSRNDARTRMFTAMLPAIYKEYQYQQMPIGKMDVVLNFKPEVLRAYYEKWYRPDQQGIVIVGDFDPAEMEKKVVEMFSDIPMPENAAERTYPEVSNNEQPIFFSFTDPELQQTQIMVNFKRDRLPFEYRNTDVQYVYADLIPEMICSMINERLQEHAQDATCQYAYSGVGMSPFFVSSSKDSFMIIIIPKDDIEAAYNDALAIVARACKTGFTDSEVERARDKMLANYERALAEKDKTDNDAVAQGIIRHFIDNVPNMGPEMDHLIASQMLNSLPVEAYNEIAGTLMTPNNQVITVTAPEGTNLIVESEAVADLNNALNAEYEAFRDEVITEPLIAKLPKKGKVKSTSEDKALGTKTFTLSNGIKVVVKATDFSADEILFQAWENGGKRSFEVAQAPNVLLVEDYFDTAKMGPFTQKQLTKYLAGKKVGLRFGIGNFTNYFEGSARVKDLQTLMELIYVSFTDITPDQDAFQVLLDKARVFMANYEKDPNYIFKQRINKAKFGDNALMDDPTVKTLDEANFAEIVNIFKKATANPSAFTFNFVGNIDEATFIPMLEQYIASLPKGKAQKVTNVTNLDVVKGENIVTFDQPSQTPSVQVYDCYSGTTVPFSLENTTMMGLVGDVLQMMYTKSLREEMGGTYGAGTYSALNPTTLQWQILYQFQTSAEMQQAMRDQAEKELNQLLTEGANADYFARCKEALIKQLEINERTNGYWKENLLSYQRGYDMITGARQVLEGLTLDKFNAFMKQYLVNTPNRIEVVMNAISDAPDAKN